MNDEYYEIEEDGMSDQIEKWYEEVWPQLQKEAIYEEALRDFGGYLAGEPASMKYGE